MYYSDLKSKDRFLNADSWNHIPDSVSIQRDESTLASFYELDRTTKKINIKSIPFYFSVLFYLLAQNVCLTLKWSSPSGGASVYVKIHAGCVDTPRHMRSHRHMTTI